jgi:hypothetical protein
MKPITLTRKIELEKYELLMEIGRQENRQELHSILLLAKELGGKISPNDICEKLLLGRPPQVGRTILDRCRYLDLIDTYDRITEIGYEALRNEQIYIPERGRYLLWYTNDPLHSSRVLHIEALPESSLYNEVYVDRNGDQSTDKDETEEIPDKIKSIQGKTLTIYGNGRNQIQIRKINSQGLQIKLEPKDNQRAILRLNPKQTTKVTFDGRFKFDELKPEIKYDFSWRSVLGPYADSWETTNNQPALRSPYHGLKEEEIFTFTKNLHIKSPTMNIYGEFEDTIIQNLPIKPATQSDAEKWGKHLLKKSINTYMDQELLQENHESIRNKFPDYPNFPLPTNYELLEDIIESNSDGDRVPPEYWYLQAPIDLTEGGSNNE